MSKIDLKIKGAEYYKSLDDDTRRLIDNVMFTTVDICNELNYEDNHPILFYEAAALCACRWEMLGHMLNNEYYDENLDKWVPYEDNTVKTPSSKGC